MPARRAHAWTPVSGAPEQLATILRDLPPSWLPDPAADRGPGHWGVALHAGPVVRTVTCAVGEPHGRGNEVNRRLRWQADPEEPSGERVLPAFHGTLRLRVTGDRAELHLTGSYVSPGGPVGAALNPAQIQALAQAGVRWFLEEVAARVSGQVRNATTGQG